LVALKSFVVVAATNPLAKVNWKKKHNQSQQTSKMISLFAIFPKVKRF